MTYREVDGGMLTRIVVLGELLTMEGCGTESRAHGYGREAEGLSLVHVNDRVTPSWLLPLGTQDTQLGQTTFMVIVILPHPFLL
jgi:hypothetical protein